MANTKSAKKAILTSRRNRTRNVGRKSRIKTLLKAFEPITGKDELQKHLNLFYKVVDSAPMQVIHPNKASRLKSQAARIVASKLAA